MLRYKTNTSLDNRKRILDMLSKKPEHLKQFSGRTNGVCVQINGEWSCGKSLFLAFIAVERNEMEGLPVVCNMRLQGIFPFYRITDNIEIIKKLRYVILEIDEIRRYMDSYLTQSKQARFISNLTADLGKQSCDFYYTDQSPTAAPTRVRNNISFIVYPRIDERTNWITVYCFHGLQEYFFMSPFFYFGFYAPDYWWAYDTTQKIDDYKFRFPVKKHVILFRYWIYKNNFAADKHTMNLWNLDTGQRLSGAEQDAILTFMEEREMIAQ